jgi:hypothetical protein
MRKRSETKGFCRGLRVLGQSSGKSFDRSPGLRPGKSWAGTGVIRSLPCARENSRNSRVTRAQSRWRPKSRGPVLQAPSRRNPVLGSRPQSCKGWCSTLRTSLVSSIISVATRYHNQVSKFDPGIVSDLRLPVQTTSTLVTCRGPHRRSAELCPDPPHTSCIVFTHWPLC